MKFENVSVNKSKMRLSLIKKRNKIKDVLSKKKALNQKLLEFLKDKEKQSIAGYYAINSEMDITNSLKFLISMNFEISLPQIVKKNEAQKFVKNLEFSFTNFLQDSFKNCSLYIICNNHPIFSTMPITILSQKMKNPSIIFDYWNNFTNQRISFPNSVSYVGLGNLGKALSLKNE